MFVSSLLYNFIDQNPSVKLNILRGEKGQDKANGWCLLDDFELWLRVDYVSWSRRWRLYVQSQQDGVDLNRTLNITLNKEREKGWQWLII